MKTLSAILLFLIFACEKPDEIRCYEVQQTDSIFRNPIFTNEMIFLSVKCEIDTLCMDYVPENTTSITKIEEIGHYTIIHKYDTCYELID